KGTLVHRALELLFCHQPGERSLATALSCLDQARAELSTDPEYTGLELTPEEEADFAADAEQLLRNYFQLEDPATVHPIGLELRPRATHVRDLEGGRARLRTRRLPAQGRSAVRLVRVPGLLPGLGGRPRPRQRAAARRNRLSAPPRVRSAP